MGLAGQEGPGRASAKGLPAKIRAALEALAEAYDYARDTRCDVWEFAVEIDVLQEQQLAPNDLRWLVRKGYVEHRCETTKPGAAHRKFRRHRGQTFYGRSCFVLTSAGLALARSVAGAIDPPAGCANLSAARNDPPAGSPPRPHWNVELHELSVEGQLIKRFETPAPNQATVLAAFEEEGWPPRIDDPLSQEPRQDQGPKRRLNDTVKGLNRSHKIRLIQFHADGTGEGVRWEWVDGGSSGRDE